MEERMTVCNMSIEAGARAGMIAPDETTFEYLRGREYVPQGADYDKAVEAWKALCTDEGASYDVVVEFDAESLIPQVTWGTSPGMGAGITDAVPNPADFTTDNERKAAEKVREEERRKAKEQGSNITPGTQQPEYRKEGYGFTSATDPKEGVKEVAGLGSTVVDVVRQWGDRRHRLRSRLHFPGLNLD
jgi:3-isopropylmalate/(R)-2-methylmalate dehydratase large subunit